MFIYMDIFYACEKCCLKKGYKPAVEVKCCLKNKWCPNGGGFWWGSILLTRMLQFICTKSSFRKLVLQEGQSSVRGYLHGHVCMKDAVLRKWSLLEGQPLIQGLFTWKCLDEGYHFRKVVFLREVQPLIQGLFPRKCMYVCMQGTVSDKWSSLEGQPLIWGLFTWNCMYWLVLGL